MELLAPRVTGASGFPSRPRRARRTPGGDMLAVGYEAFVGSGTRAFLGTQVGTNKGEAAMANQQKADFGAGQNGHEEEVARYEQELAAYLQERIKPGLNSGAIPLVARSIAKAIAHREHPKDASEDAAVDDEPSAEADEEPSAEADEEPSAEADEEPSAEADEEPSAEAAEEPSAQADEEPIAEADEEPSAEADEEPSAEADEEPSAEADDEPSAEADDEPSAEADDEPSAESEAPPDFEADMHELQAQLGEDWILRFSVLSDEGWLTAEKDDGSQRLEAQTAAVLLEAVDLLNENGGRST